MSEARALAKPGAEGDHPLGLTTSASTDYL